MNEQEGKHDLEWLAFCYAAAELDAAEVDKFEALLADDQQAREALARAVELTQTVAAAESQCGDFVVPASHERSEWNQRLSWMAVGGLASLLLALLWSGVVGPTWQTAQRRLGAVARHDLALAWNQTRTEFADVREAGVWPVAFISDADDETSTGDWQLDEGAIDNAPSWMTAAVFGPPSEADAADQPAELPGSERLEN
jgi:hypothetical protein